MVGATLGCSFSKKCPNASTTTYCKASEHPTRGCCCLNQNLNAPRPLFLTFRVLVAKPKKKTKKLLHTAANSARGLLNKEK